ncbi:aminoglycoside phosphotransferase family protein [Kribbella capetownensis]|uniref:Aminoglycoside phosphotransferase family protein n=1 Tax=Kribbella capetownensis TaxID=1572659 RepID=A0A4R0JHP4_9ACTN|nr:aminoglycoside phosphotransferase family protein [Kribbella capetownensis]TCC46461.1 aminoglycoside phosphotransferase family protein [Kribbella capetownensis]
MDEQLVRALLQDQHPDLAELELREVVGGWGNQMWRLGDDLAVRMPRTEGAPELLVKEHRWLPGLAARLPLPVPIPVHLGEPSDRFSDTWLITTWVHGEPADHAPITDPKAADVLVDFLQALHTEAPADAPVNDRTGLPQGPMSSDEIRAYAGRSDEIRAVWEDAIAAPAWDGPPVWLHGDLHPANVVVADGTLAGVVDFGEICAGDPANDLAAAWILLPAGAADRFFERYQPDEATVRRARGWAVVRAMFLIAMGINGDKGLPGGKAHWGPIGRAALDRLL